MIGKKSTLSLKKPSSPDHWANLYQTLLKSLNTLG